MAFRLGRDLFSPVRIGPYLFYFPKTGYSFPGQKPKNTENLPIGRSLAGFYRPFGQPPLLRAVGRLGPGFGVEIKYAHPF